MGGIQLPYPPVFANGLSGLVPNSDEDSTKFLSADGTFDIPAGSGGTFCGARYYNDNVQSIPNNAGTLLLFNTPLYDTDNFYNAGEWTVPFTGVYLINYKGRFPVGIAGQNAVQFVRVNGTTDADIIAGSALSVPLNTVVTTDIPLSFSVDLNANDIIRPYVYQSTGGALNYGASSAGNSQGNCAFFEIILQK